VWVVGWGGLAGEIEQGEGVLTPDGQYQVHSLNIACTCKLLAVVVKVVHGLRWICVWRWWVAQLARSSEGREF
jgi:hypothetical protein